MDSVKVRDILYVAPAENGFDWMSSALMIDRCDLQVQLEGIDLLVQGSQVLNQSILRSASYH